MALIFDHKTHVTVQYGLAPRPMPASLLRSLHYLIFSLRIDTRNSKASGVREPSIVTHTSV